MTTRSLHDLQNQDIHALVSTFIQSNADQPLVGAVVSLLDTIAAKAAADLQRLINQLLSKLTDRQFYDGLFNALKAHVEAHPWPTAFLIVGIVLLCNPLAMAGFGSLGPVAGSLAAAWQSSMGGTVAAGSAFATLQSWGMMYSIVIPVAGTIITAGSIAAATAKEQIREACNDAWVIANAGGQEVKRWSRGEYGNPVTHWRNGVYGDPVTRWWKGEYGSPVAGWANSVTKK
ncbi:hypothetical protein PILCRDRAFT_819102 [Piloderma croceum F 1598]|uniref:Uncharacterized protein n=1 Tax=Piloderma croceum (strain F 1598) TaxID=765440 RepID=A0A0C3C1K5_PILCF|nr:hypothetical protein PILCRDRAFT_819102 [Piloderma croceum F 1598]